MEPWAGPFSGLPPWFQRTFSPAWSNHPTSRRRLTSHHRRTTTCYRRRCTAPRSGSRGRGFRYKYSPDLGLHSKFWNASSSHKSHLGHSPYKLNHPSNKQHRSAFTSHIHSTYPNTKPNPKKHRHNGCRSRHRQGYGRPRPLPQDPPRRRLRHRRSAVLSASTPNFPQLTRRSNSRRRRRLRPLPAHSRVQHHGPLLLKVQQRRQRGVAAADL